MRFWPRRNPKKWDLVLTDVNRPQMDGVSLVRALRALPECKCTPILVLTTEAVMQPPRLACRAVFNDQGFWWLFACQRTRRTAVPRVIVQ